MTALALLTSCVAAHPTEVHFVAQMGQSEVKCGPTLDGGDGPAQVRDLRLFIHKLRLVDSEGAEHPMTLTESRWQSEQGSVLLDFEDGCHNGSQGTNAIAQGTTRSAGPFQALAFVLGPSPSENHADPLQAAAPLSTLSMHWTWSAGYKFIRLDWLQNGQAYKQHLGSTGCAGTLDAPLPCARPNRAEFQVPLQKNRPIVLEIAPLLQVAQSCMGEHADAGCAPLFAALNLQADSGLPMGHGTLFVESE